MNRKTFLKKIPAALIAVGLAIPPQTSAATLQTKTLRAWSDYVRHTEQRIESEIAGASGFLALDFKAGSDRTRVLRILDSGRVHVEKLKTTAAGKEIPVDGGMIHHWYGAILLPGVRLEAVVPWVQDYDRHSAYFPEVEASKLLSRNADDFRISLRLVRRKVVTVHYNTEHSVTYRKHSPIRVSSRSVADRIAELSDAGSDSEREKTSADDSGFLWRLNSYWRFEQTEDGVIVECESISLSRSIPFGFGWLVGRFVESVPQESLNDMLVAIRNGVSDTRRGAGNAGGKREARTPR